MFFPISRVIVMLTINMKHARANIKNDEFSCSLWKDAPFLSELGLY